MGRLGALLSPFEPFPNESLRIFAFTRLDMRLATFAIVLLALAASAPAQEGADALLARGAALIQSKPAEAVKLLQQAVRLDPERGELRFQLGLAYHAIGDEADAENELREAVGRMPDSASAHNYLGIALFQLGNAKAALEEFRAATRLAPNDPNAHFNLGEALARTGDSSHAVEELRAASGLAPGDGGLARLVKVVETALTAPESTIKVDVRQVLVPVVVVDKEGHHVTGLSQADFKVFEDGLEQKITAFSAESSGLPQADITPTAGTPREPVAASAPARQTAPVQPPARRTYLIVIDTLHASFNNFTAAREALEKLFQQEHSEGSQYVLIAIGTSSQMVVNTTPDPAAVLAVLQSKKFQKIFLDGQQGGLRGEMERYQRDLNETRSVCDLYAKTGEMLFRSKCETGKARVPTEAEQIAELDRTLTVGFLRQFRALVMQLARARDRRTIVLVSDGFQIVPGREAYDLLSAYFPEIRGYSQRATERMQSEFEPILQVAAKSNIKIDTIDSRGLYGQKAFDASSSANPVSVDGAVGRVERNVAAADGNTLMEIAEATGGTAFHDNNDLFHGLQRAFADGREYYTIAYVSGNANLDGKFRAITVRVPGKNVVVNAKKGYWGEPAAQ
jgi:VWFA-related protein